MLWLLFFTCLAAFAAALAAGHFVGKKKFLEVWRRGLVIADLPGSEPRPSPVGSAALSSAE